MARKVFDIPFEEGLRITDNGRKNVHNLADLTLKSFPPKMRKIIADRLIVKIEQIVNEKPKTRRKKSKKPRTQKK